MDVNRIDMNNSMILEKYSSTEVPMSDWNIEEVFSDVLMCTYADTPEGGDGDHVLRKGIVVPINVKTHTWRVVEVIKKGNPNTDNIKIHSTRVSVHWLLLPDVYQ